MYLSQPSDDHLVELMSWFTTENELKLWSGPNFRFPFDLHSFKHDLQLDTLASFSLLSAKSELLGFGQYYLRLGKCHLGRLVINPGFRGQGIAAHLIQQLCSKGKAELSTHACSLFVLEHNDSAIKSYQKLGFIFQSYPEELSLKNCLYMVKA
ncbi:GNAT family N-acetyltransferase [Cognaticolwellia beringensis]|uniref:N-acetyltransferase n=1 Tax=Cognaticolwellia beringensis TaxID=1967665 RepID=A0A222G9V9_9GAMM|nr:GNAT family N-acetyltransferase [Cognaticolwellia beringensis]ASP48669.1 N-acetyltransferase [Cognaticolwellia beringensis]